VPTRSSVLGSPAPVFTLGSASLIMDDARALVRLSAPIDMRGTVYRVGSTGMLATFRSLYMTSRQGLTDVTISGGRLWATSP